MGDLEPQGTRRYWFRGPRDWQGSRCGRAPERTRSGVDCRCHGSIGCSAFGPAIDISSVSWILLGQPGLTKADLTRSKTRGKIVSKKASAAGKKSYMNIKPWVEATQKARKQLGLRGFVPIKKGSALYKAAKALLAA